MNQAPSVPVSPIRQIPGDNGAGGFRINLAEIAAAQQAPSLDVRSFAMSEAAVGAAVGNAAQGLSEGGLRITQEIFASTNRRKVDEASSRLAAASQDIAREIKKHENDPSKWVEIFNTHAAKWEGTLLDDKTLSPAARDAISAQFSDWKIRGSSGTLRASFDQSVKMETEGLEGKRITAAAAGNWDEAEAVTREQEARGLIGADTAARQRVQTAELRKDAEKKAKWGAEYKLIDKAPDAYLQDHGAQRADETPEEHMHRIGVAERAAADKFQERSNGIADALSSPDFKPNELPALLEGLPPRIAAKWRAAYADSQDEKMKAIHADPRYINATWGKLDDMVQSFDRKAPDARERYSEIRALALTLPEGWRQHPLAALDGKWSAKPPDPDKAIESELDDSIDGVYKAGGFGPVTRPITEGLNPASGQWEKAQDGVEYLRKREGREPLPEDQIQGPRSAKAALKIHVREYLRRNPGATPEDAFKALNDMRDRQRDKAAPSVNFTPSPGFAAPPVADAPAVLDSISGPAPSELPAGSDSGPSTSLLPNPPPDAAGGGAMWVSDKKGNTTEVTPMTDEDVKRWRSAGDTASKVWDIEKSQWVMRKPSELQAGRYAMPTNLFPQ